MHQTTHTYTYIKLTDEKIFFLSLFIQPLNKENTLLLH